MIRLFLLLVLFLIPLPLKAQTTVYLKPAEALKIIFKDSKEVTLVKKKLTEEQQKAAGKKLGSKIKKSKWNFYVAKTNGKVDGYAIIDNEIGKTEPITFITAINPKGQVIATEILVYRESHGSEVHRKKFLKQYKNKTSQDPIFVGRDIKNITGATLSARAVSKGVKRALILWKIFYGKN